MGFFVWAPGGDLLSRGQSALSSAQSRFTVLFGMGRRGSNSLWPPSKRVEGRPRRSTPRILGRSCPNNSEEVLGSDRQQQARSSLSLGIRVQGLALYASPLMAEYPGEYPTCVARRSTLLAGSTLLGRYPLAGHPSRKLKVIGSSRTGN